MMKKKLIEHLQNDIYCRIAPSKIDRVGVFAIRDIPKEIDPFKNLFPHDEKIIVLTKDDIKHLDPNVKQLVTDFFGSSDKKHYDVLYFGPNFINISFYLNHSTTPNLDIVDVGSGYLGFRTNSIIKKGTELFINYNDYQNK